MPAELILLRGAAGLPAGRRDTDCCGSATPTATSSGWARPARCTTSSPAAGSRRRTSPARGRSRRRTCRTTSRRSRSSTALARARVGARHDRRRPRRCCSRRCRRPRASNRKQMKAPEVAYQGEPQFEPIPKTTSSARGQHRQGHHQGRRPLLHVLPGRLVHARKRANGPWEVAGSVPEEIYEIPASSPAHNVTYVTSSRTTRRRLGRRSRRRRATPA